MLQQHLPLVVLKPTATNTLSISKGNIAIVPTVYGMRRRVRDSRGAKRRWGPPISSTWAKRRKNKSDKAMYLPFTVCAAECEAAEAQSDDEAYTLQVPKHSEGKTKVMRWQYLPLVVLKLALIFWTPDIVTVATVPTVYGIETLQIAKKYIGH